MNIFTMLCLGDSYTIGEGVTISGNFPYQTVQYLRKKGLNFSAPEIVAKTGWTTDELDSALKSYVLLPKYDVVTLLIGVNNQYRGSQIIEYKDQLEALVKKAISFADNKRDRVYLISIPDYSVTPFAENLDKEKTAKEIEVFNSVNKALTIQYKIQYLDITVSSKNAATDYSLLTSDKLHPSESEYNKWAENLSKMIAGQLK